MEVRLLICVNVLLLTLKPAFLDMDSYYSPFCDNLGELAPSLEILDFSTTFHNSLDIIGNFFSSLEKSIHFPRLRELHIRAPFNDDESCEEGSTPLVAFIRRHATQLEALSLPCPIEDFDNDYLYEPLDLPSLPKLTKLDAPVLWANLLIDRDLIPNLSELKVWLTLPRENDTEFQTQETSKEELEPLLAKLSELHTLRALDLCQSSFEFDAELLDMLAAACPSLEWLGILIFEADDNWVRSSSSHIRACTHQVLCRPISRTPCPNSSPSIHSGHRTFLNRHGITSPSPGPPARLPMTRCALLQRRVLACDVWNGLARRGVIP